MSCVSYGLPIIGDCSTQKDHKVTAPIPLQNIVQSKPTTKMSRQLLLVFSKPISRNVWGAAIVKMVLTAGHKSISMPYKLQRLGKLCSIQTSTPVRGVIQVLFNRCAFRKKWQHFQETKVCFASAQRTVSLPLLLLGLSSLTPP